MAKRKRTTDRNWNQVLRYIEGQIPQGGPQPMLGGMQQPRQAPMPEYAPMRNPFAMPAEAARRPMLRQMAFDEQAPRDAAGNPISDAILAQMDRIRALRDAGRIMTGGQQAQQDFQRRGGYQRSALWG